MAKDKKEEIVEEAVDQEVENTEESTEEQEEVVIEKTVEDELAEMKDKYIRLYSEFENFRRRTAKERLDLIQTSTESLMVSLLPILDDFERAAEQNEKSDDVNAVKEGMSLINNKINNILALKGLKKMESSVGSEFDAETQEAITQIPAPSDDMKGKVIDEVEKGYQLKEKIIRFPKVVIGQ